MSEKTLKTVSVCGGPQKDRTAVIVEQTADHKTYNVVAVGDFVRVTHRGESYDGVIRVISEEGFALAWFDANNRRQLDGFGWQTSDVLVY